MPTLSAILIISIVSVSGFGQTANSFVPLVNIPGTGANLLGGVNGVAVDSAGNVYFTSSGDTAISRGSSVLRWDHATGILTSVAGNGTPGFSGDNGPATSAQLDGAIGVAVDGAGNLYIADSNNGVVRKVSNGVITTAAGGAASPGCDNCPATSASLEGLTGVTVDSAGNLYIFTGGVVRKVSNGVITEFFDFGTLDPNGADVAICAAAADNAGNLYVANYRLHLIQKLSDGVVTTVAGTGKLGFSGDNGPATSAQLFEPHGVAVDAAGNVYIADTGNQRIRKVSNGVITTVAGGGAASSGLGDNGPATSAVLNAPVGVGVDSSGNLYIEDTFDKRIRRVSNGVIITVAGGGSTSVLLARSAGTVALTGNMSTTRFGHTATLLEDGKVLIAGGIYGGPPELAATAELYDPATRTFAATGNMTAALATLTATRLVDGKVLIVGVAPQCCGYNRPASAELYDPSTGTFFAVGGPLNIFGAPDHGPNTTATLLNSGKVLITGAFGYNGTTNFVAELYDPLAGTFTATGSMALGHSNPTATLLADGKVLIAEGICDGESGGSELYDLASGTFSPTAGNMPSCTVGSTATLLPNGKVLIAGGPGVGAEVYDPSTETFTASAGIDAAYGYAATLLFDGTVLISGGNIVDEDFCSDESVADAELYDPATGTFGSAGVMTTPRSGHQSTLLADGTVLISGGIRQTFDEDDTNLASAEIYTPPVLAPAPALFFFSQINEGGAVYDLQFPDGNPFGYFKYVTASILYHYDMGFEAFIPGSADAIYLYDFTASRWLYTSSTLFPYLYDFTLNTWIYYFPDVKNPGHYTTNPRMFSNLTTGAIFTM